MGPVADLGLRLVAATLVGALIGLNRDLHGKPTGVRTMGLVGLASAATIAVAVRIGGAGDVTRAIQGLMTGIGFLGAGVIVKEAVGDRVRGLTTAATIWLTAALGIICGLGFWVLAVLATGLGFIILVIGGPVEKAVHRRWPQKPEEGQPLP